MIDWIKIVLLLDMFLIGVVIGYLFAKHKYFKIGVSCGIDKAFSYIEEKLLK